MNKYSPQYYDDEIDLMSLFKTVWDGKIKILLITVISFLITFVYISSLPNNYLNTLNVSENDSPELIKFYNIKNLLQSDGLAESSNEKILDEFIDELKDYEEFIFSIKNTKKIEENISRLKIEDQEIELFKYSKLLEFGEPKNNQDNFIINFKWHDTDEAKKILNNILNLASKNLKKKIDKELILSHKFQKKLLLNKDKERLDYLKEQSSIAKELNIINNQIDNLNLSQSSVSLSINTAGIAYYLRGYKAIDKEIELIQNRKYQNLKFIEQELDSFKNTDINFVEYNIYLMESKSLKKTRSFLTISILLGLIVGVFYVLISNAVQSKSVSKKKNKGFKYKLK